MIAQKRYKSAIFCTQMVNLCWPGQILITREQALIRIVNETVRMKLLPLVKGNPKLKLFILYA